jgi:hypothetical protein
MQAAASKDINWGVCVGGEAIIINEMVQDRSHHKEYFQTRKESCLD